MIIDFKSCVLILGVMFEIDHPPHISPAKFDLSCCSTFANRFQQMKCHLETTFPSEWCQTYVDAKIIKRLVSKRTPSGQSSPSQTSPKPSFLHHLSSQTCSTPAHSARDDLTVAHCLVLDQNQKTLEQVNPFLLLLPSPSG